MEATTERTDTIPTNATDGSEYAPPLGALGSTIFLFPTLLLNNITQGAFLGGSTKQLFSNMASPVNYVINGLIWIAVFKLVFGRKGR